MFASWWLLVTPLPALPVEAGTLGQLLVPGCTVSLTMSHSLLRACGSPCWLWGYLFSTAIKCSHLASAFRGLCLAMASKSQLKEVNKVVYGGRGACRGGVLHGAWKKEGDDDRRHRHLAHLNTALRKAESTSQCHTVLSMLLKEAAASCSPAPSYF